MIVQKTILTRDVDDWAVLINEI